MGNVVGMRCASNERPSPRTGVRGVWGAVIAASLCALASGCVTTAAVKDASTKHANNLAGIQQAVAEYRRNLDTYYDRLIRQQREAHVALHVDEAVKEMAEEQPTSIAREMLDKPTSQKPATDLIQTGAELADAFTFWGDNFDRWVEKTKGDTLEARRQSLLERADELEKGLTAKNQLDDAARRSIKKIRDDASKSDDALTYIAVAIELKKQRRILDTQLDLLAAQVTTMQAFHAAIDQYLSINATIDGGKIAEAAAAGSKANTEGIQRAR